MKNISKQVLELIKQKRITPIPRWYFIVKKYLFLTAYLLSIFLISFLLGYFFFSIEITDFIELMSPVSVIFEFAFVFIYFIVMIILILIIFFFGYRLFRCTENGYKYSFLFVVLLTILLSISLSYIIYLSDLPDKVHLTSVSTIPAIHNFEKSKILKLYSPERGLIVGNIQEINLPQNSFKLITHKNKYYFVYLHDNTIYNKNSIRLNNFVKVKGKVIDQDEFDAYYIQEIHSIRMKNLINFMNFR